MCGECGPAEAAECHGKLQSFLVSLDQQPRQLWTSRPSLISAVSTATFELSLEHLNLPYIAERVQQTRLTVLCACFAKTRMSTRVHRVQS